MRKQENLAIYFAKIFYSDAPITPEVYEVRLLHGFS